MVPGFAFVSEIIPVFSRKVIFGYPMVVAASMAIGLLSMSVWAHHMFAVGMGAPLNAAFAASTMLIAVPTGIKIFNWVATMYGGRIRFATPMLFACAFLFQFLCAGLTGIMLSVPIRSVFLQVISFGLALFHHLLVGALVFAIVGAIYDWFPTVTVRLLSERMGRWHFWLFVIGFNVTFLPMHWLGMIGMPRRIYTYPADRGWEFWNLVASLGVLFQAAAIAVFLVNIVVSLRRGAPAGAALGRLDARVGHDLAAARPQLRRGRGPSRRPLWDLKHPDDPDGPHE
jgi:cytochrome c oxidase subunit 1